MAPLSQPAPARPERDALVGGLAFLDGTASRRWGVAGLRDWFDEHLVRTGYMKAPPLVVSERSAGTVALYQQPPPSEHATRLILVAARCRVLGALRGLTDVPTDDRFLTTAIFTERVVRQQVRGGPRWVPRPVPAMSLSGIVLTLFAADALSHREIYDQLLSVCDTCERVTFHAGPHHKCPEHVSAGEVVSRVA